MTALQNFGERTRFPQMRVAILGAGAGGLAMAYNLKRGGWHNFTIYERSDGVGGVWRQNTYPGAACDVMSHFYSFSFALKPDWSRRFATQPEILAYFEDCAERFDLRRHLRCDTTITSARWDESRSVWELSSEDGETFEAEVLVSALGLFSEPKDPTIDLHDFDGRSFHSARWDHDHDLSGENVAVIGTGPSAIQFVPEIADVVKELYVFQREPGWVMPKADPPYSEEEIWRFRHLPFATRLHRAKIYYGMEKVFLIHAEGKKQDLKRGRARAHLESQVESTELRTKLLPSYPIGCKRTLLTNDWYPTLTKPNVEVVTSKPTEVKGNLLVSEDGTERMVDTIIFATGFKATDYLESVDVVGRDGSRLRDEWGKGASAYLGIAVPKFPNLFIMYGPNTNALTSLIFILERQAEYIVRSLRRMRSFNSVSMEVRPSAAARFAEDVQRNLQGTVWLGGCTTYFRDEHGNVSTQYPHRAYRYLLSTRYVRIRDYLWSSAKGVAKAIESQASDPRREIGSLPGA